MRLILFTAVLLLIGGVSGKLSRNALKATLKVTRVDFSQTTLGKRFHRRADFTQQKIVVVCRHWLLDFRVVRRDYSFQSKTRIGFKDHANVVWCVSLDYFPGVDNDISFPASLEWHELERLETLPVVQVSAAADFSREISLNLFNFTDIFDFGWIPYRATCS